MMYKLYTAGFGVTEPNAAMSIGVEPQVSFLFNPANTDYQAFKKDLANGVALQDDTGTAMSAADITSFLQGLK